MVTRPKAAWQYVEERLADIDARAAERPAKEPVVVTYKDGVNPNTGAGRRAIRGTKPKASEVRFERAEQRRRGVEEALRQGHSLKDSLELVGMSSSMYQKNRSTYPHWGKRWDVAKLQGRSVRNIQRADAGIPTPVDDVPASFPDFITKYFPDRDPPMQHHLMLQEVLTRTAPREVVLFLLWPGAGKSSVIEDHICRKLALEPDHRFRVVSSNDTHSGRMLDFCKRRFTDVDTYPEFIGRFGPFYEKNQERHGRPWSADAITVYKSSGTERDRSIAATGWRAATLGARIDTLIWDDVQTPENLTQAETIFSRLRDTYFSRGKGIRTVIIGNRCGAGDLYERMLDEGLITDIVEVPAAGALGADPNGPSVPEWWVDPDNIHKKNGPCCGGRSPFRICPANGLPLTPQEVVDQVKYQVGKQAWYSLWMQDPIANSSPRSVRESKDASTTTVDTDNSRRLEAQ